jgi:shikimate dehydrogenase
VLTVAIDGRTNVAGVIGDPVEHSISPLLHNTAFSTLGLDWVYVAFPVPAGRGEAAVAAMADLGIRGLSVTMPHKVAAARACERLTPVAEQLGAANTVTNLSGSLVGDSTDGPGFIDSLAEHGWSPEGKRCLVLGAGGAARAVVLALAQAEAKSVVVVARQREQALAAAALAGASGTAGSVGDAGEADLVVNATPVGMTTSEVPFELDPGLLGPGQLVADLIYAPALTPLLAVARERGAATTNGLGMLVHQAARQFRAWTGQEPPLEAMSAAVVAHFSQLR